MAAKKSPPKEKVWNSDPPVRGRPRSTLDRLPKDWEEQIRALAQQGAGRVEWQCALGLTNVSYLTLMEDYPQFRQVISQCKLLAQAWWEQLGRRGAAGQVAINAPVWALNMKNRYRWREATVAEVRSEGAGNAQPKTIVRTVMPAVKHSPTNFDTPGDAGVVEE